MAVTKSRHLVLSIFFLFIAIVPVYWLVREKQTGRSSIPEDRKLADFPALAFEPYFKALKLTAVGNFKEAGNAFFGQFVDRTYQRKFENAASDQFPLRFPGIVMVKAVERAQIALAYAPLADPAVPTDMVSGLYIMRDGSQIFSNPVKYDENSRRMIDEKIISYEKLIAKNPGLQFYAYYIERIEYSSDHPLNTFFPNADQGRNYSYFKDNAPETLKLGALSFKDLADYTIYNYRSDHHWNIRGALRAYDDIYKMLASGYPEISPPLSHDNIRNFSEVQFLGSFAGRTLYPVRPDAFEIADVELPPFRVFVDDKEIKPEFAARYFAGSFPQAKYAHHYNYFSTGVPGEVYEYVFDNGSDRDLLIIGNSFKWPIYPLLAYHYHHTYSVNPLEHANFQISKFIMEHQVDDILFLGDADLVFLPIE